MALLPTFPKFDIHQDANAGPRWKKWLQRFERLLIAMDVKDDARKRALLLHYAGTDVDEVFETLENVGDTYQAAADQLMKYFTPRRNVAYEVYQFRQAKQGKTETLDAFHTKLRQLAQTCEFSDVDKEICAQIILNCQSQRLRRRALREPMTLESLLSIGRALETSERDADVVEAGRTEAANAISASQGATGRSRRDKANSKKSSKPHRPRQRDTSKSRKRSQSRHRQSTRPSRTCYFCGGAYPHARVCPAKGKKCRNCGKIGHFDSVCRSATISTIEQDDDSDVDYIFANQPDSAYVIHSEKLPTCEMTIGDTTLTAMIDSGASVNVLNLESFNLLQSNGLKFQTRKSTSKVFAYGTKTPLPVRGIIEATVNVGPNTCCAEFHVVNTNTCNLLSFTTARQLKLISFNSDHVTCNLQPVPEQTKSDTCQRHEV